MNRTLRISTLVALAGLILGATPAAQAVFISGTQGMADNGTPTINTSTLAAARSSRSELRS